MSYDVQTQEWKDGTHVNSSAVQGDSVQVVIPHAKTEEEAKEVGIPLSIFGKLYKIAKNPDNQAMFLVLVGTAASVVVRDYLKANGGGSKKKRNTRKRRSTRKY
jgi:hypothetical protein